MSKANKKALGIRDFERATLGGVAHPNHSQLVLANKQKKDRKREERRKLNLSKFKREQDRESKYEHEQKPYRPNGLVFSGGE